MTRTSAREIAVRLLYSIAVTGQEPEELLDEFFCEEHFESLVGEDEIFAKMPDKKQMAYIRTLVMLCTEHRCELSDCIEKYSKGWKLERISRTASAILRCALCEILYMEDVPDSAAINEAVELAKSYEEPDTVAFVNGVLGGFMRGEKSAEISAKPDETSSEAAETETEEPVSGDRSSYDE